MTEAEWRTSTDALAMITQLRQLYPNDQALLERMLHRYYLACCRAIWKLLPDEKSREGIVVAERYLDGQATDQELGETGYSVEAAAFGIDYAIDLQDWIDHDLQEWIKQVEAIPANELRAMIHPPEAITNVSTYELLKRAAYFADFAVIFPRFLERGLPNSDYFPFLSPTLLRDIFGNPFARRKKAGG
jgi:hypothetical protein